METGDVQKFIKQMADVSGANNKGYVASTHSFQAGARAEAVSAGVGLMRYFDNKGFKWELRRSPSSLVTPSGSVGATYLAYRGITDESFKSDTFDCFCFVGGECTVSLEYFLSALANRSTAAESPARHGLDAGRWYSVRPSVPFIPLSAIEATAQRARTQVGYTTGAVSLDDVCAWQRRISGLRVIHRHTPLMVRGQAHVLGKISFSPPRITVTRYAAGEISRQRFTLAHELGHLLLGHSRYMTGEHCTEADLDAEVRPDFGIEDINRMEWQAHHFASCLLLPKAQVTIDLHRLVRELGLHDHGYGTLYVDRCPWNQESYYAVTNRLMMAYGVSRQAITIRLKELKLMVDKRTTPTAALEPPKPLQAGPMLQQAIPDAEESAEESRTEESGTVTY